MKGDGLILPGRVGVAGILNMVMVLPLQVMPPRNRGAAMMGRTKQIHIGAAGITNIVLRMMLLKVMPPR